MKNNIIKFIFENKSYEAEIIEEQMDLFDKSYTIKSMVISQKKLPENLKPGTLINIKDGIFINFYNENKFENNKEKKIKLKNNKNRTLKLF